MGFLATFYQYVAVMRTLRTLYAALDSSLIGLYTIKQQDIIYEYGSC